MGSRVRNVVAVVGTLLVLAVLAVSLWRAATNGHPMSMIDEHVHLDTAYRVHAGEFPHRGSLYTRQVVREWACGVGHEGGPPTVPCGDPTLGPASLPSGQYTTGYIHYPTWYVAADGWRRVLGGVTDLPPIALYRTFGAAGSVLGGLLCLAAGWLLGLRGSALAAMTTLPLASTTILMFGFMANPQSVAVALGALVAAAGLRWALTGRGFWWLVAATAVAAGTAVTNSLPAGAFLVAMVLALLAPRFGAAVTGPWRPRWWQVAVLSAVVVVPVLAYSPVIESRATIANDDLYGFAALTSPWQVIPGLLYELFVLHTPWFDAGGMTAAEPPLWQSAARQPATGLHVTLTVLLFGALTLACLRMLRRPIEAGGSPHESAAAARRAEEAGTADGSEDPATGDRTVAASGRSWDALGLLAVGVLVAVVGYPPALRLSNALTFGFDYGIVMRYSASFAPLIVALVLLLSPSRWFVRLLAAFGVIATLSLALGSL